MEKSLAQKFGATVVQLRKAKSLSQEQFANLAAIDRHYMSDIENGRRKISLDIIEKIAKTLEIKVSELFVIVERSEQKD